MERVQHQVHGATATAGTTDAPLSQRHLSDIHHVVILSRQTDIFSYLTLLQVPHPDNVHLRDVFPGATVFIVLVYFRVIHRPKEKKWSKV